VHFAPEVVPCIDRLRWRFTVPSLGTQVKPPGLVAQRAICIQWQKSGAALPNLSTEVGGPVHQETRSPHFRQLRKRHTVEVFPSSEKVSLSRTTLNSVAALQTNAMWAIESSAARPFHTYPDRHSLQPTPGRKSLTDADLPFHQSLYSSPLSANKTFERTKPVPHTHSSSLATPLATPPATAPSRAARILPPSTWMNQLYSHDWPPERWMCSASMKVPVCTTSSNTPPPACTNQPRIQNKNHKNPKK
jgi:hypothetical protein